MPVMYPCMVGTIAFSSEENRTDEEPGQPSPSTPFLPHAWNQLPGDWSDGCRTCFFLQNSPQNVQREGIKTNSPDDFPEGTFPRTIRGLLAPPRPCVVENHSSPPALSREGLCPAQGIRPHLPATPSPPSSGPCDETDSCYIFQQWPGCHWLQMHW